MSELRTSLTDAAQRAGGALTRRATLLALGGAALVAAPAAAKGGDGAKAGKKARKAAALPRCWPWAGSRARSARAECCAEAGTNCVDGVCKVV